MLTIKPLREFSVKELDQLEHEVMVELRSRNEEALDEYMRNNLEPLEKPNAN